MDWTSVEDSVYQANVDAYGKHKAMGMTCPNCGKDDWKVHHGIDSQYKSQYNPGEYVDFICVGCGHTIQEGC